VRGRDLKTSASKRHSTSSIEDIIANPIKQNIPFMVAVKDSSVALYNVGQFINGNDTVLYVSSQRKLNQNIIHSDFKLLQEGNPRTEIPSRIENKIIDSLAGQDRQGRRIPDPKLVGFNRVGLEIAPRQTVILDMFRARENVIKWVNSVIKNYPVARRVFDRNQTVSDNFYAKDDFPANSLYDIAVNTFAAMESTVYLLNGVSSRILVRSDETIDGYWVIYQRTNNSGVYSNVLLRRQKFDVSKFWEFIDWYEPGYSEKTIPTYTVDNFADTHALNLVHGDVVKVKNVTVTLPTVGAGTIEVPGKFELYVYKNTNGSLQPTLVGLEKGTVKILETAYIPVGFDSNPFDSTGFDFETGLEFRYILQGIKQDIFVEELSGQYNTMMFYIVDYILSEQKYIDWFFKTSFISVKQNTQGLEQYPSFVRDRQQYYEQYINEVKPYRTKIREYILGHTTTELTPLGITDFDLPAYYDATLKVFRSPNGDYTSIDQQKLSEPMYKDWLENHKYTVESIETANKGYGYFSCQGEIPESPDLVILRTDTNTGSNAAGYIQLQTSTGAIQKVYVTDPGSEYTLTPRVSVEGNGGTEVSDRNISRFKVVAKGDFSTESVGPGLYNAETNTAIFSASLSGYTMHRIRRVDGKITFTRQYNTAYQTTPGFTGFSSYDLAYDLGQTTSDYLVVVYSNGEPAANRESNGLLQAMYRCGASSEIFGSGTNFKQSSAYILIGIPGSGRGNGIEHYVGPSDNATQAWASVEFNVMNGRVVPINQTPRVFGLAESFGFPIHAVTGDQYSYGSRKWSFNGQRWTQITRPTTMLIGDNESRRAKLVPRLTNRTIRKIKTTVKFDRVQYFTSVIDWQPAVSYTIGTHLSYQGQGYVVKSDMPASDKFNYVYVKPVGIDQTTSSRYYRDAYYDNANDRIMAFYVPTVDNNNVPKDIDRLVTGVQDSWATYNGTTESIPLDTNLIGDTFGSSAGTEPGAIIVVGGQFIDIRASHAPEELVPGITYDSISIKSMTATGEGYRLFIDMNDNRFCTDFSSATTTTLAQDLLSTDTEIIVTDGSKLSVPNPGLVIPGIIHINGERIIYYTKVGNVLGQLRRGVGGTGTAQVHMAGSRIEDTTVPSRSSSSCTGYEIPLPTPTPTPTPTLTPTPTPSPMLTPTPSPTPTPTLTPTPTPTLTPTPTPTLTPTPSPTLTPTPTPTLTPTPTPTASSGPLPTAMTLAVNQVYNTTYQPIVFNLSVDNVSNGTTLYYKANTTASTSGVSNTWFEDNAIQGTSTVTDGVITLNKKFTQATPDRSTVYFDIHAYSLSGPRIATTPPIVYRTSKQWYDIVVAPNSVTPKTVAILGDSVSMYGGLMLKDPSSDPSLVESYVFSNQYGNIVTAIQSVFPNDTILNVSRGGMTTDEALTGVQVYVGPGLPNPFAPSSTFTAWYDSVNPDVIVLRYGVADAILIGNATATLNNIQSMIDYATASGNTEVILLGPNPISSSTTDLSYGTIPGFTPESGAYAALQAINSGIQSKAIAQGLRHVNVIGLSGTPPVDAFIDGIHPIAKYGGGITSVIAKQLISQTVVNEGTEISLTLQTSDVPPGTKIPYAITGVTSSDFSTVTALTGNIVVDKPSVVYSNLFDPGGWNLGYRTFNGNVASVFFKGDEVTVADEIFWNNTQPVGTNLTSIVANAKAQGYRVGIVITPYALYGPTEATKVTQTQLDDEVLNSNVDFVTLDPYWLNDYFGQTVSNLQTWVSAQITKYTAAPYNKAVKIVTQSWYPTGAPAGSDQTVKDYVNYQLNLSNVEEFIQSDYYDFWDIPGPNTQNVIGLDFADSQTIKTNVVLGNLATTLSEGIEILNVKLPDPPFNVNETLASYDPTLVNLTSSLSIKDISTPTFVKSTAITFTGNIPYGPEPLQKVSLYVPNGTINGVICHIHGGSWMSTRASIANVGFFDNLVLSGYVVLDINYRSVTDDFNDGDNADGQYPNNVDDIVTALRFATIAGAGDSYTFEGENIWARIKGYVDQNGFIVTGGSAGGHLSVMAAGQHGYSNGVWPVAVIQVAGPMDLIPSADNPLDPQVVSLIIDRYAGTNELKANASPRHRYGTASNPGLWYNAITNAPTTWINIGNNFDNLVPSASIFNFAYQLPPEKSKIINVHQGAFLSNGNAIIYGGKVSTAEEFQHRYTSNQYEVTAYLVPLLFKRFRGEYIYNPSGTDGISIVPDKLNAGVGDSITYTVEVAFSNGKYNIPRTHYWKISEWSTATTSMINGATTGTVVVADYRPSNFTINLVSTPSGTPVTGNLIIDVYDNDNYTGNVVTRSYRVLVTV
jgi:acetyl esterase/lipase